MALNTIQCKTKVARSRPKPLFVSFFFCFTSRKTKTDLLEKVVDLKTDFPQNLNFYKLEITAVVTKKSS